MDDAEVLAKVLVDCGVEGYRRGRAAGRIEGLNEAVRIILSKTDGRRRPAVLAMVEHIMKAVELDQPADDLPNGTVK